MSKYALILSLMLVNYNLVAADQEYKRNIIWEAPEVLNTGGSQTILRAAFSGAVYDFSGRGLPNYREAFSLPANCKEFRAELADMVFDIAPDNFNETDGIDAIKEDIELKYELSYDRKAPMAVCSFIPIRRNPYNQQTEILISFKINIQPLYDGGESRSASSNYADHSILATGNWYKIAVAETGIYKITHSELQNMGIDVSAIDPRNIRIFGNGGGMLPESLTEFRHDDLAENSIYVEGEADGKFDQQDYVLFYGHSPHQWKYEVFSQAFRHEQNIYSDSTFYFITTSLGPGKRISEMPSVTEAPDVYVSKFTDYDYHEKDLHNLSNIGRVWYGEVFDVTTSYDFNFSFPNIDLASPVYFRAYIAAKSEATTVFKFYESDNPIMSASISGLPASANAYARPYIGSTTFNASSSDVNIGIDYNKVISNSIGWLNFFELNVTRNLVYSGSQMSFRDPVSVSPGIIAEFSLANAGQNVRIWNVTDPTNVKRMETIQSGNDLVFRISHDTLAEFTAFDGSSYLSARFAGTIDNQDLHGTGPRDMVIITNPLFTEQAQRLADFHAQHDGLTVLVTETQKVYNEFSSGAQDITAIRNFMKMLYDEAPAGQEPRYLLLFGDASFDYKDRIENNSNFVPTWEEEESLQIVESVASDDYYGFLDGPGDNYLDIGIGRLPVQTQEQATVAVDKIIHYATNTVTVMKDWRNVICFVADDEDNNEHLKQAEKMAAFIDTNYSSYNIDKIYVDAFPQISTPGGQRAPEVNNAINNRMDKGCLIVNYTGHGGEVGWGHERFLANSDINSWTNYDRMPIFITATCEFSRYDDPTRVSAGEYTYLNPQGGAVAMFTTARATFGGSNFNLNTALFDYMFEQDNGEYYRFGELIRLAKNSEGGVNKNDKKFILLGDPALHLAYPQHTVVTTKINYQEVSFDPDTLNALKKVTIEGEVQMGDNVKSGFNGTVYPIVYDKPSKITTLAADPTSYEKTFEVQNNILYKGKAQVTDGKFSFTFIVPKDIAYQYGFGKISYYAANENEDAHGNYRNIMVGGLDQSAQDDLTGPAVKLYMNNEYFVFGGITDENPDMLAYVEDISGINTVGTGIGHDIVAILDRDSDKPIILNEFYESALDSYTSGTIRYPFHNLEEGLHTLSLKVWDVFNNSADAYIEFNVVSSGKFTVSELRNYPNPFNEQTTFAFSHNQAEGELDVKLSIYNLSGQVVKTFETSFLPTGYRSEPIIWDGRDGSGYPVSNGFYIYRLLVRNEQGQTDDKSGKLVILK